MMDQVRVREKLDILETLYREGYQSDVIERAVDKLIGLERERTERECNALQARLDAFEAQYQMATEEFYSRYEDGKLDDRADFVEWSSLRDMKLAMERHLQWLTRGLA